MKWQNIFPFVNIGVSNKKNRFGGDFMEKKNKKKLSYNNDKTGKGGGRAHEKSISINQTAGNDLKI